MSDNASKVSDLLVNTHGWSPEQAKGIAANLQMESSFNPTAVGDNGNAYGIAQWQKPRQADFQAFAGKAIQQSSLEEQVAFVNHELRNGKERAAGQALLATKTAGDAAEIVSRRYERPMAADMDAARRRALAEGTTLPAVAPTAGGRQGTQKAPGEVSDWPRLPTPQDPKQSLYEAASASLTAQAARTADTSAPDREAAQSAAADVAWTQQTEGKGVMSALGQAVADPRIMATWSLLDGAKRGVNELDKDAPPDWFEKNRDQVLKGFDGADREYLNTHVRGPETLQASLAEIASRKEMDRQYGLAGGGATFVASMAAGVVDPATWIMGAGVSKIANLARIGHAALAADGAIGAARASFVAEMAATNVGLEGIQAAMGETKTSSDYAMAAGLGVIMALPFTRGAVNGAVNAHIRTLADDIQVRAVGEQAERVGGILRTDPTMEPGKVARAAEAAEVNDITAHVRDASTPSPFRDRAVPESAERGQRAEYEGIHEVDTPGTEKARAEMAEERVGPKPVREEGAEPKSYEEQLADYEKALKEADPALDVDAHAKTDPSVRQEAAPASKTVGDHDLSAKGEGDDFPRIEPSMLDPAADVAVSREIPGRDGTPIRLNWQTNGKGGITNDVKAPGLKAPTEASPRQVLARMLEMKNLDPKVRNMAEYLLKVGRSPVLDGIGMRFLKGDHPLIAGTGGAFHNRDMSISLKVPAGAEAGMASWAEHVDAGLNAISRHHQETVLHEIAHAMLSAKIQTFLEGKAKGALKETMLQVKDLHARYVETILKMPRAAELKAQGNHMAAMRMSQLEYAAQLKNPGIALHEFMSQVAGNEFTREVLRGMPGKPTFGLPTTAWMELMTAFKKMLGFPPPKAGNAEIESLALLDRLISLDGSNIRYYGGEDTLFAPALNVGTKQRGRAEDIMQHARDWAIRNPINLLKTKVGTWGGARSDGLVLAGSKNPIMQMFSGIVAETTTGASGRKATVAIRSSTMNAKIVGNTIIEHQAAFDRWRQSNGISSIKEAVHGEGERRFNREVYTEITKRRDPNYQSQGADANVKAAADSLEKLFKRAADDQRAAGVLGADSLPPDSRGYVPQKLDGARIQTLTAPELIGLNGELSTQFQRNMGWDKAFADSFAPYYVDRVRQRSQGSKDAEGIARGEGDSAELVRQTLEDMAVDPNLRSKAQAASADAGKAKWLKSKLSLDLSQQFAPGKTLFDVFNTDAMGLAREYAHRSAGTVALTESGILGLRGIRELRQAAVSAAGAGENATLTELRAFDRVVAEILGGRTGLEVSSGTARDLGALVRLQRLGGLVFAQAAEAWNMTFALGVGSVMRGIPSLGRHLGDVKTLKEGGVSANPLLRTIEVPGGEFGMRDYKMALPLDAGDAQLADYMNHPGLISRLLRTGEHAQQKIVGFKALVAVQHRHVAEEIVRKSMRFINEGKMDTHLADMGFTPDLVKAIKAELPQIAVFDGNGHVVQVDMTRISDPRIAEAYGQALHRGTGQIIQSRFAGERSAWFSNDYMQLLFQLRGFGLTAVEKQWGRAQMNHGYAKASGMLMAQLALSLPIYAAKAELVSAGMESSKREEFLKKAFNPAQMVKGVLSYASLSGLTGDVLDTIGGLAGGWGDSDFKDAIGASNQSLSASRLVPIGGTVDSALRVASGRADIHTAIKQLPFSNVWYLQPLLNLTK